MAQAQPAPTPASASSRPAARGKSKRDLVLQVLDTSRPQTYIPAGFFMHFAPNRRLGDPAISDHLNYFRTTGMDFVKIQYEQPHPKVAGVKSAADWAKIPVLPEEWFEPTLYVIRGLVKEAKAEALILPTLYSPYQMAKQAVAWSDLVKHVYEDPEAVSRGMENVLLSTLNFARAAVRAGVDGFYTCTQGGETNRIADRALFNRTIKAFDMLQHKQVAQLTSFNILHVCDYDGDYNEFTARFQDYSGHVVNTPLSADGRPLSLAQAADIFKRPVMGGLERKGILSTGTPGEVARAVKAVLKEAPSHLILSANCTVRTDIPIENLQSAIKTAHEFRA